jgi:hypothetical protein
MLWDGSWSAGLVRVEAVIWAVVLLPSYTFVWGLGRLGQAIGAWRERRTEARATAAAGAPAGVPLGDASGGSTDASPAESDDEPRAAE